MAVGFTKKEVAVVDKKARKKKARKSPEGDGKCL